MEQDATIRQKMLDQLGNETLVIRSVTSGSYISHSQVVKVCIEEYYKDKCQYCNEGKIWLLQNIFFRIYFEYELFFSILYFFCVKYFKKNKLILKQKLQITFPRIFNPSSIIKRYIVRYVLNILLIKHEIIDYYLRDSIENKTDQ
jgi:hypothetical protein